MAVDVVRQENPESMQMSTSSKTGLNQVVLKLPTYQYSVIETRRFVESQTIFYISVIREPSFLVLTNPVQKFHPMQMNFLGKNIDHESLFLGFCENNYHF